MKILTFLNNQINTIVGRESDPINQERIKMLLFGLACNFAFTATATFVYLLQGPSLQLCRASLAFLFALGMFVAVYFWNVWRAVSHMVIILMTIVVWSNLIFFVQGTNIPTLQFAFLTIVFSFYVHGLKWGLTYSFLNVVPIIIYAVFDGRNYFHLSMPPQPIKQPAFVFVITYNFLLIILLHFHFFRSFNRNFIRVIRSKDDLKALNQQLKNALEELEQSADARMNFLSTVSHELRTPLNGVIGMSNILSMQNPRDDQQENLSILKFSAENLLALINDILDLNKLESHKVELEAIPFDLSQLLKNTFAGLKIKAQEKNLDFRLIIDDKIEGKLVKSDPTRLTQVLLNLLNNALKFTLEGSVELTARVTRLTADSMSVNFTVKDTGIGIDADKLDDIFEPFTQASKSTTRKFGGTGLGLAIVKRILDVFGSKIHILSQKEKGSELFFEIDFDYTQSGLKPVKKIPPTKNQLAGLKVLVAEDNQVNIMVIKKILLNWNIIPEVAENGAIALKKAEEAYFDVILMDLHMPEMDGYEAARLIRKLPDPKRAHTPIIALTAAVSTEVDKDVIEAGINSFLSKPFKPDDLYNKLLEIEYFEAGL